MWRIFEYFLKPYAEEEFITRQKVRVFVILSIGGSVLSIAILASLWYRGVSQPTLIIMPTITLLAGVLSLPLLRLGYFRIVSHALIIVLFSAAWSTMFGDSSNDRLERLDTIVFIMAIMMLIPFSIARYRLGVVVYTFMNIVTFIIFLFYMRDALGLTTAVMIEYFVDVTVAMLVAAMAIYLVIDIYMRAMEKLHESQKQIERHLLDIQEQNRELMTANEEFEAMNEELTVTQNEIIRINEMLSEEKELLDTTLRSIEDVVITTDTKGAILLFNRAAETVIGINAADATGRLLHETLSFNNDPAGNYAEHPFKTFLKNGGTDPLRFDQLVMGLSGRSVSGTCTPLYSVSGDRTGAVMVFRDVTDAMKMEEELRKAARIETLGIFAGGIAHDFNNLLTAVIGNISIARHEIPPDLAIAEYLELAEEASLKTKELAGQLLTFSKGGAPVREAAPLQELIRDSARFALSGSDINLNIILSEGLWNARVDRRQISQVIHNMVLNARQALGPGGVITLSAENTPIDETSGLPLPHGNYIRLTIADNGHGIPPEIIGHVFDPFFSTRSEGSGLGLAVSYSIIKKHDGHITVRSEPSRGTIFDIYLPATNEESVQKASVPEPPALSFAGSRMLAMDDDASVLKVLTTMLRFMDVEIDTAPEGETAVAMYHEARESGRPYDCVILDLTVRGGMGGEKTVALLRAVDPSVRTIVFSGYANDPVLANYRGYGFDAAIQKPFNLEELRAVITALLGEQNF